MKLYVLPIGSTCNAKCPYCITRFRHLKNSVLNVTALVELLNQEHYDRIEVTGGGEPSLHPKIDEIVEVCEGKCLTNIYTNGHYVPRSPSVQVCLSRAHYNDTKNEQIMGVKYDMSKYAGRKNLKLSLILHKSGISDLKELLDYLKWAKDYAGKVVVRQLFEYEDAGYGGYYAREYVSSPDMAEELGKTWPFNLVDGNYFFNIDGLEVEFEGRSCACGAINPVLGADGILREGWSEL